MNKKLEVQITKIVMEEHIPDTVKIENVKNLIKKEMWELQEAFCNSTTIMWDDNTQDYMTNWINRRYK